VFRAIGVITPAAILATVAYAVWSAVAPPFETTWERWVDEAAQLPFRLGCAALAWHLATRESVGSRAQSAWARIAIGFGIGAIANLLRLLIAGGGPLPPLWSVGLAVPQGLALLGGLWRLARLRSDPGRGADWLDSAVIVIAGFMLVAHFVSDGSPLDSGDFNPRRWLFVVFLAGDLFSLWLVGTVWFRRPEGISRAGLGWMTLGFALISIMDLVFDQQIRNGTATNGGVIDALVTLSFTLLLLGLDRQRRHVAEHEEPRTAIRQGRHIVAPIAIMAATVPLLQLAWGHAEDRDHLAFHVTGIIVLLVLVLIRQHLARHETIRLARERMAADARFRSLVQRSSDAILQVSTDHVIEWASPSAGELAGTIPALLVGRRIADLAHPDDRDALAVFLANAREPFARNAALRWRIGRPDHWHDVESVVTDLTLDDDVRSFVLNTRNVTERVRLEQQLRQAQKLEAVGRLAGGIAHDFNNILAAIITHAQLVRDDLEPGDARAADLLEIEQTAQRGAALTRRLLSFSRPEVGETHVQPLRPVLEGMEPMLRRLLVSQVELELILPNEELWIRAADGQMEQILMNLAINARDAMPEGGVVRIALSALTIRPGEANAALPGAIPGRWAELTVHDDGVGMDEETLARLFEPFFTTKPSGLGTGLGLTTVRGIVRALGGHVYATSAPSSGTTMRVLIPAVMAEAAVPRRALTPTRTPTVGRPVILVVDDEAGLRRALERFLEKHGFEVLAAGSAQEGLAFLDARAWQVDIVVTDMVMPRMSGREFVRILHARRPTMPVLCMSGHMAAEPLSPDEAGAPWAPEYLLAKPFPFPEFLVRVRAAMGAAEARSEPNVQVDAR
jgi:PAS domain S-box-containing protein